MASEVSPLKLERGEWRRNEGQERHWAANLHEAESCSPAPWATRVADTVGKRKKESGHSSLGPLPPDSAFSPSLLLLENTGAPEGSDPVPFSPGSPQMALCSSIQSVAHHVMTSKTPFPAPSPQPGPNTHISNYLDFTSISFL